ncbi:hypothetical protein [Noviherbaspirillum aridicola]|uniref:hypothetical protein n=1 Tax=Noviherbaspirillum aridicola TaxID=2849687 RepID=UPI001C8030B7|nr:hypothetical protein [Noviherbaspirillum aridicola]
MQVNNESIRQIWNAWKQVYDNSSDPVQKKVALDNLRALDLADDGQKNNSVDSSMKVWDIQDPSVPKNNTPAPGGSTPITGGSTPTTGGSTPTTGGSTPTTGGSTPTTGGSTPTTGGSTPTTGGSTPTTGGSTPTPGSSTPTTGGSTPAPGGSTPAPGGSTPAPGGSTPAPGGSTPKSGKSFDEWWSQLPVDIRNKLGEKFGGPDRIYSEEEKKQIVQYLETNAGPDGVVSAGDIERMRKSLGNTNRDLSLWDPMPDDVKNKLKEKYAGSDGIFSDDEWRQLNDYIKSKLSTTYGVTPDDIDKISKDLDAAGFDGLPPPPPKSGKSFDEWWNQLPDDIRNKLKEKYAGSDAVFSEDEKKLVVEYMEKNAGPDGVVSAGDIERMRKSLGNTNRDLSLWDPMPDDVKNKLKEKYAGSDGIFSDDEWRQLNDYIKSKLSTTYGVTPDDIDKIRKDL